MSEEISDSLTGVAEKKFIGGLLSLLFVPERLTYKDYAEKYVKLSASVTAKPGRFDCSYTPCLVAFLYCVDVFDGTFNLEGKFEKYKKYFQVRVISGKKSAQIGFTQHESIIIEKIINLNPQNIMVAFPSERLSKKFAEEKFRPAVFNSPKMLEKIGDPTRCNFSFYKFPGAWLQLVSAASSSQLKSSSAPILLVEEPDEAKQDLKGQGNSIDIFLQRSKTFPNSLLIYAGTPIEKGFSNVDEAYDKSCQFVFMVRCHECGEEHILSFNHLKANVYPEGKVDVSTGIYNPDTAYYECPHCQSHWDFEQKNSNLNTSLDFHFFGWKPLNPEGKYPGFAWNELMSKVPGSSLTRLMRTKLEAEVRLSKEGKDDKLKSFYNNSLGESYSPKSQSLETDELRKRRLNYSELKVPVGGIVLTMGVDVQHNRFAIVVRAWGRNGNSWAVWWGEIFGNVKDPEDPVWKQLTDFYLQEIPYVQDLAGKPVKFEISAASIDSGDGNTTKLVYNWVKTISKRKPYTFATKGDNSVGVTAREIFSIPQNPDVTTATEERKKLMETMGVHVYLIGVQQAKDEVYRKLSLDGKADRMYHYLHIREDYEEQVLSERKRGNPARYIVIPGKRNEALDCEVLALHAAHGIKLHLWAEVHWTQIENSLIHKNILQTAPQQAVTKGLFNN